MVASVNDSSLLQFITIASIMQQQHITDGLWWQPTKAHDTTLLQICEWCPFLWRVFGANRFCAFILQNIKIPKKWFVLPHQNSRQWTLKMQRMSQCLWQFQRTSSKFLTVNMIFPLAKMKWEVKLKKCSKYSLIHPRCCIKTMDSQSNSLKI